MSKCLIRAVLADEEHYKKLPVGIDVVNVLYTYAQERQPHGIMKDLCDALAIDGYYRVIDDAFALTSFKTSLNVYRLRMRLKLAAITTLADQWEVAFEWAKATHSCSRNGLEFFRLQQLRADLPTVAVFYQEARMLLSELFSASAVDRGYLTFLHFQLGYMPTYFSMRTKLQYAKAIIASLQECSGAELSALENYVIELRAAELQSNQE